MKTEYYPKSFFASGIIALVALFIASCGGGSDIRQANDEAGETVEAAKPGLTVVNETPEERDERMRWWRDAKFGLFIHWGVYAVPAGKYGDDTGHGEWIMHRARIPSAEYKAYAKDFNPTEYDPVEWVRMAKEAGMRYIVITSKHHDGFALYPSDVTTWDVADATPYGRDLLAPLVEAAHDAGLKIGFYYSQAQDWNHPGGAKSRFEEGDGWDEAHKGDFDKYLQEIAQPQVREILTRYPIDILWWDTPTWMNEERTAPLAALTALRPGIITNNRLGAGFGGDTATPEQFVPATGYEGDWETCMTMNRHWGYNAYDDDWKSSAELIRKLADICAKGGNFLLNVGPTAKGTFPQPSIERLADMGRWLAVNGDSIYGTTAGPFPHLSWGVATRKDDRLFLHVFKWPDDGELRVPLLSDVGSASLLVEPDVSLPVTVDSDRVVVQLPPVAPDPVNSVVVLELAEEPRVAELPTVGRTATASSAAPDQPASHILDGTAHNVWSAVEGTNSGWVEIDFETPMQISGFAFDEPDRWPRYRQQFRLEMSDGGKWQVVVSGNTRGHGHSEDFPPVSAQRFRLVLEREAGPPGVAEWQLYAPE